MNAFDYFFENTAKLDKNFLVGKEEISFQDLYRKSISLSNYIKSEVGSAKNIILSSPNNAFFLQVYFAIIKSGNTCIPLDPMIEEEKFNYIKKVTSTGLMFLAPPVKNRLGIGDENCVTPNQIDDLQSDETFEDDNFDSNTCAEIIFTSGSTGSPKGVMLSHKNIIANTESIIEYLAISKNDRVLVVLPFYYCYGLSLLHTHLRVGGSIVFNNSFIFLGAVINDLKNNKCTGFAGVPSHFQILLRKSDSFKSTDFPDLRYVTQAGGKLAPIFIDEFREAHPDIKFIVMYGQTEATARLSYLPPELYSAHKGSIGKGIPGVTLKVVNKEGKEVKVDEIGEIIAQGNNVMLGYFMDQEESDKTLKNGWLQTGDLGTIDKDGYIFLTARKKEIIKVGGNRISPKEIEGVILGIPDVVDCSIEGIEDELLGEALKATVVVNGRDNSVTEDVIKEHCATNLVLFKVPQIIEIKEQLVMSATGKKVKN